MNENDYIVNVRRQPDDYKIAKYYKSQIKNLKWDKVSGGANIKT